MISRLQPASNRVLLKGAMRWLAAPVISFEAKILGVLLATAALLVIGTGSIVNLIAAIYTLLIAFGGYAWFRLLGADRASRSFLPSLFLVAFAIRALAVFVLKQFLPPEQSYDSSWYELYGMQWSHYWQKLSISRPIEMFQSEHLYSVFVGIQYYLSNDNIYVPLLTNALVGALIPTVVYSLGSQYFGGDAMARAASVFAVIQTSMIVWSAIAMRDVYIVFFVTLVLKEVIAMVNRLNLFGVLRLCVWLAALYLFRPYVVAFTIVAIGLVYTFSLSKKPLFRILIAFTFLAILGTVFLLGGVRNIVLSVLQTQTENLDMVRQTVMFKDPHQYNADVRYNNPVDVLKFLPIAELNFWGGPFLVGEFSIKQIAVGLVGIVSWYATYWYAFKGYVKQRGVNPAIMPILAYFTVGSIVLSLICGNWQECVRLRSMFSPLIELLAGVGWVYRRETFSALAARK